MTKKYDLKFALYFKKESEWILGGKYHHMDQIAEVLDLSQRTCYRLLQNPSKYFKIERI